MPTFNLCVKVSFVFEVEAENEEAARKEAARLEAESKLKAQKDAQAKLLVAKKSIKNIINSPNFQKFAHYLLQINECLY